MKARADYLQTYALYHRMDAQQRKRSVDYYRGYARFFPAELRSQPVLDIGCGWGFFLEGLQQEGFIDLKGIDLSVGQIEACRAQCDVDVEQVDDSRIFLQRHVAHYGAIAMIDVVEHIAVDQQVAMLEAVFSALRPGGLLLVRVPNANSAVAMKMRYVDLEHTCSFSEHSLHALLTLTGFKVELITDEPSYGRLPASPWRHPKGVLIYWYYRLLTGFFRYWRYLEIKAELGGEIAAGAPLAPNIIAIARKPRA